MDSDSKQSLNLKLSAGVVFRLKAHALARGTSVSALVAEFAETLPRYTLSSQWEPKRCPQPWPEEPTML